MVISEHYSNEKQRFLENCVQCGQCAKVCPILPYTDINEHSPQDIQKGVFHFIDTGASNQYAYTKAFACMECFKCAVNTCPKDLNPMLIHELIKGEYIACGLAEKAYADQQEPDSIHRVLASIQIVESDHHKITTPSPKKKSSYLFFPGCNVYFQPEKILNTLDIMDAIGDDYALSAMLPGQVLNCYFTTRPQAFLKFSPGFYRHFSLHRALCQLV